MCYSIKMFLWLYLRLNTICQINLQHSNKEYLSLKCAQWMSVWNLKWLVFTQSLCLNYQKNNWGETQNGTNNKTLAPCLIWCGFRRNDLTHGCCHALGSSPAQRIYNDWISTGERSLCKLTTVCGSDGMAYLQKTFHFRSKKSCCRYFSSKKQDQRLFQESSEIHIFWRKQASLTHSTSWNGMFVTNISLRFAQ